MSYLLTILACALLLVGFLFLTAYEARRGSRFFAATRARLDRQVGRIIVIITNVDLGAFLHHLVHSIGERVAHDLAHAALVSVRFIERSLTRLVRFLRERMHERVPQPHPRAPKVSPLRRSLRHAREVKEEAQSEVSE